MAIQVSSISPFKQHIDKVGRVIFLSDKSRSLDNILLLKLIYRSLWFQNNQNYVSKNSQSSALYKDELDGHPAVAYKERTRSLPRH